MNTSLASAVSAASALERVAMLDWKRISDDLDARGNAMLEGILSAEECRAVSALYSEDGYFRSRVVMGRHGFGRGEYQYFRYPLPGLVEGLRSELYSRLVPTANRWNVAMGMEIRYPEMHVDFLDDATMRVR